MPTFVPFNFHWYAGVDPPFVGVALKDTFVPEQIVVPGLAVMVTEGVTVFVTIIDTVFDVAVAGETQAAFEVITQETVLPSARAAFVYVLLFVPTFAPFNFLI